VSGALVCFDVDGTLETSAGPVTVEQLRRLEAAGVAVAIVSPSPARPPGFPEFIAGATRHENLAAAVAAFPAALRLYVSDNNDQAEAVAAGFIYVDRLEFRA
jgi:hypothetical protein